MWSQQSKLVPLDGKLNDDFGLSVSLGEDKLVIGAKYDDDAGDASGT
jgi:hypothetical protein